MLEDQNATIEPAITTALTAKEAEQKAKHNVAVERFPSCLSTRLKPAPVPVVNPSRLLVAARPAFSRVTATLPPTTPPTIAPVIELWFTRGEGVGDDHARTKLWYIRCWVGHSLRLALVSAENQTLQEGLPRSYGPGTSFAKGADAARPIVHACADFATSLLWPHWTSKGFPEFAKAADACGTLEEAKESYTELFRGLCTERGKGETPGIAWVICLTVLGTVVRELGGLKHFKCPGGDAVTGARESGPKLWKCVDSGSEGMGGAERCSWCSLGLCYAPSRCYSVSAAFDYWFTDISQC
ncbi:hypothetical protein V8E52_009619 [Russula decolorans]